MERLPHTFLTLLVATILPCAWGACTQDFNQFTPDQATSSQSASTTSSGSSSNSSSATTSSGGGQGGAGVGGSGVGGQGGAVGSCGDGNTGPGEDCDDGNTTPYDGCSPMCAVEDADSCGGTQITLTTGNVITITNNTMGAPNDAGSPGSQCGGLNSGDLTYEITAGQDGLLYATLTAAFSTLLYTRNQCFGSANDTIQCDGPPAPTILTQALTMGEVIYLFVDGYGASAEEGPFTLTLELQ